MAGSVLPEPPRGGAPDLLAGATIVTADARGPASATRPGAAGALVPAGAPPSDAPAEPRSPALDRLRLYGGGLLVCLCLGLFGWIVWRGREPAPVTVRAAPAGTGAEIKVQ